MPRFVYVGPIDGIDLPLLRLVDVRQGDEFDCTPEQADILARQADLYQPLDEETTAIAAVAIADAEAQFAELVPAPPAPDEGPDIPILASGGVIHEPTVALAGEAGPEVPTVRRRRTKTDTTPFDADTTPQER